MSVTSWLAVTLYDGCAPAVPLAHLPISWLSKCRMLSSRGALALANRCVWYMPAPAMDSRKCVVFEL